LTINTKRFQSHCGYVRLQSGFGHSCVHCTALTMDCAHMEWGISLLSDTLVESTLFPCHFNVITLNQHGKDVDLTSVPSGTEHNHVKLTQIVASSLLLQDFTFPVSLLCFFKYCTAQPYLWIVQQTQ
jgi:hypothetical protein